jgi:hypothetical protein
MYYLTIYSFEMIILLFSSPVLISYSLAEPIKASIITFDDGMLSQFIVNYISKFLFFSFIIKLYS